MDLDQLDAEQHGPMRVRVAGTIVALPSAADMEWKMVALAVSDSVYFHRIVWPRGAAIQPWQVPVAQQAWLVHNGLLDHQQLRRLVMMMERYYEGIEFDLRTKLQVDAGQMWRDRRWRELLNIIDQLPSDSQMNRLLTSDKEYMAEVLKSGESASVNPSIADWSQTNRMLADLIDAVNALTTVTRGIAGAKQNDFRPYPRPRTAIEEVRREMDRRAHEEMNAILLRGRPGTIAESPPDPQE